MCDKNNTCVALIMAIAVAAAASAQQPAFEAASIRPSAKRAPGADWVLRPGGQFIASNITLEELIATAYGMETFRVLGGPDWGRTTQYDVQARGAANVTADQTRMMLRTLLQDRFRLRAAVVRRDVPVYELMLARSDRMTGPRMPPSTPASCVENAPVSASPGAPTPCGRLFGNPGRLFGRRIPLDLLATRLSPTVGRVVLNRTGLTDMFDIDLEWTPDSGPSLASKDAPALFTALGEQLGLRLDLSTGQADVLVIESVEPATEN
jgi:uncharacterized protein (TIGR03435 family)